MSQRLARAVSTHVRSWWFLLAFLTFTAIWWVFIGPLFNDPWPYVGYTTVISVGTWVDLVIVGIGQRAQEMREDERLERDEFTQRLLLAIIEEIRENQE